MVQNKKYCHIQVMSLMSNDFTPRILKDVQIIVGFHLKQKHLVDLAKGTQIKLLEGYHIMEL